jgi:uncharacterized membrane protein YdcZ (DUF606 family)
MILPLLFSLAIGALGVFQNTINKKLSEVMSLPMALVVNNIILLGCSVGFFFLVKFLPDSALPELLREKGSWQAGGWKIILPGIFGFMIIAGAPWAIEKAGATKVFIGIIVAQIVASILWDQVVENIPASPVRIAGAVIAFLGALLAVR